jgi:hypothetical protein
MTFIAGSNFMNCRVKYIGQSTSTAGVISLGIHDQHVDHFRVCFATIMLDAKLHPTP